MVLHLGDGRWRDEDLQHWRDGTGSALRRLPALRSIILATRQTRVILATCHRDHDPQNNDGGNLAALCQRCHILHDKVEPLTYLARQALGDMFTGPYRI